MTGRKLCSRRLRIKIRKTVTGPLRNAVNGRVWFSGIFLQASMTVEAALVLPLFLFFFAQMLYLFDMVRLQCSMLAALHETGTQISEYAYYLRYGGNAAEQGGMHSDILQGMVGGSEWTSLVLSETYVRDNVARQLGKDWLANSCIEGGSGGISYLQSGILAGDDIVELVADYRIKPFLPVFGLQNMSAQARYYGHAWVGYSGGEDGSNGENAEEEEQTVYITPTGVVYHEHADCTYLKPSVRTIAASELASVRSQDGSKYYACERCKPVTAGNVVITSEGNRYHSSADCTSIQRDIHAVSLNDIKNTRRACSKCSGT